MGGRGDGGGIEGFPGLAGCGAAPKILGQDTFIPSYPACGGNWGWGGVTGLGDRDGGLKRGGTEGCGYDGGRGVWMGGQGYDGGKRGMEGYRKTRVYISLNAGKL